jgi:copper homeostasis protein
MSYQLEICANSINSAIAAQRGGAHRIELCTNLSEGGTTPSYGQIKWCKEHLNIEIWPLIRPRGGDFLYNDREFECLLQDILYCKQVGCDGIVTGALTIDGEIDEARCSEIIKVASPMPVAFHRAFDMTSNLNDALESLVYLGFVRVLTSGGKQDALTGAPKIAELISQAAGRIEIMPGAGINPTNILEIAETTGAKHFHTTAKATVNSKMKFKNVASKMGTYTNEYRHTETSAAGVKLLKESLKNMTK